MLISASKNLLRCMLFFGIFIFLLLGLSSLVKAESVEITSVQGSIVDFDTTRILYSSNADSSLQLRNISTGQDSVISATYAQKGYVTSSGVIYITNSGVYSWKNGVTQTLLSDNMGQFSQKNGRYITFTTKQENDSIQVWVLDTTSNSLKNVSSQNGYNAKYENALLSKDGFLAYINEQGEIVFYSDGQTKKSHLNESAYPKLNLGSIVGKTLYFTKELYYTDDADVYVYSYDFQTDEYRNLIIFYDRYNDNYTEYKLTDNNYIAFSFGDRIAVSSPIGYGKSDVYENPSWSNAQIEGLSDTGDIVIKVGEKRYLGSKGQLSFVETSPYSAQILKLADGNWYYGLDTGKFYKFTPTPTSEIPTGKIKFDFNSLLVWADENADTVTVNVYRTGGSKGQISVNYTTLGDTASSWDSDFIHATGTITFADGETQKSIKVKLLDDKLKENFESFQIKLTGPQEILAAYETNRVFIVIRDND
ncbi:Calx-beta domain-containing protein [Paenibacillus chartarius]|uniref:Calx-beta domain-containing protein n=1 Tax=Paenibacillus chartarius TaxID=747481 RepID=A0ABV6DUD0_9BACL